MSQAGNIQKAFERGEWIFRMVPNFVPRVIARPGRRLRLHPDDYFSFGIGRGPIGERRFTATIPAAQGDSPPEENGFSFTALSDKSGDKALFKDVVENLGADLIGEELWQEYGAWPIYAKFFDFQDILFHHLHLSFESAACVGLLGKPEAYYFPPEMNNHVGNMPLTYIGYNPDVTREEVRERLLMFEAGDNRMQQPG